MTTTTRCSVTEGERFTRASSGALLGALVGLVVALAATLVMAVLDGHAQGLSNGSCVAYGCVLTLLLSQAVGVPAMLAGAGLGAVVGATLRAGRGRLV